MNEDLTLQLREILVRLEEVEKTQKQVNTAYPDEVEDITPAMVNFADNSDFIFSDEAYITAVFTDADKVVSRWYVDAQDSTSQIKETDSSGENGNSIRALDHPSPSTGGKWDNTKGSVLLTGGYKICGRLPAKYCYAGNYIAVRLQISRVEGTDPIATDSILKVSIWDNSEQNILTGSYPELSSSYSGTDNNVTRRYILEVQMPDGRTFYSDTSSFSAGNNEISDTSYTTSTGDPVTITWSKIVGASRYRIYRQTPSEADTNWYLIETITNGSTTARDYGGTGGGIWTIPSFDNERKEFQKAEAFYDEMDIQVEEEIDEISMGIQIPSTFTQNGNQFIQIEILNSDYTITDNSSVPDDSIRIDKVGVSYTNGRWTASARDQTLLANPTPVDPPPSGGGGGGNPPSGTGHCVWEESLIKIWSDDGNHYDIPANTVVRGDRLVSWDGEKLVPSKVKKVIRGLSTVNKTIHTDSKELICSFSHLMVTDLNDINGTSVKSGIKTIVNSDLQTENVISEEDLRYLRKVITFSMEKDRDYYFANGMLCKNKPQNPTEILT